MLRSVFGKTLWEGRRALVWWSLGMLLLAMTALGFYPSIKASAADLQKLIQGLPQGLRHLFLGNAPDFTSPAGYLNGRVFSTIAPILLLVYAVGAGARALAGEERGHTLDLLLSTPLPRRRLALEKLAAMATGLFVLALVLWVALAALGPAFELDVSPGRVAAATFSSYLFALALGAVALAVGGATGSRGSAIGIPTTLAAAGFLLVSLAPISSSLQWLEKLSVLYYANGSTPILNGLDPLHVMVLVAIAAVAVVVGLAAFERRDLSA